MFIVQCSCLIVVNIFYLNLLHDNKKARYRTKPAESSTQKCSAVQVEGICLVQVEGTEEASRARVHFTQAKFKELSPIIHHILL